LHNLEESSIKSVDFLEVAIECARLADEKRAEDITVLDLIGIADFCDYFVICSGSSRRLLQAVAGAIDKEMKKTKVARLGIEGLSEASWILLDYGGVVVHLFTQEQRYYYDFDLLWGDGKKVEWKPRGRMAR